jgi:hypothetical protein
VLVSATLRGKLASLVDTLLTDPAVVGLQLRRGGADEALLLEEAVGAGGEHRGSAGDGGGQDRFQLPPGLQQLYVDVPTKLRLPALLGAHCCVLRAAQSAVATLSEVIYWHPKPFRESALVCSAVSACSASQGQSGSASRARQSARSSSLSPPATASNSTLTSSTRPTRPPRRRR